MSGPCGYPGPERRKDGLNDRRQLHCDFADAAADAAVKKTFNILGVDVDNPEQVEKFRMTLRFSGKFSAFIDKGFFATAPILAGLVALVFGYGILMLIADKLKALKWW